MSKGRNATISVADVYEIAADIGREFETLIDSHGAEHVTRLMQKVITALEHLERVSGEIDADQRAIDGLQTMVTHLELENSKKMEERRRNTRELEQLEDHYKQETRDLLRTIKHLQDENRRLASSLAAVNERDSAFSEEESYFEVDLVKKLETVIEKQRNEIKKLDRCLLNCKTDNEEMGGQNDKLSINARDLRRKLRSAQCQLHLVMDERAELASKVHEQQKQLHDLTRRLGIAAKECEDLSVSGTRPKDNDDRPSFSLPELKNILEERNALKVMVSDLEDELAIHNNPCKIAVGVNSPSRSPRIRLSEAVSNRDCSEKHPEDVSAIAANESEMSSRFECEDRLPTAETEHVHDLPVQGPLPKDPEDAPFKRSESGIRKLLKIFSMREKRPNR